MNDLPKRSHPRLKTVDYTCGWYFVTICTEGRKQLLSRISVGRGDHTPPQVELTAAGQVAAKYMRGINRAYRNVSVETYVIMPNHIHMVIAIAPAADGGVWSPRPTTLMTVIRSFKTLVTRELGRSIWQTSFYEHAIRCEEDHLRIWQYIDQNPARWADDEYYQESPQGG